MQVYEFLMLLATIVTALGGVGFVVVMVQTYKGQMNAQIFTELNQRYDDIIQDFPKEAWNARFNLDTEMPPSSPELTLCALRYLNLSSEEFYLYRKNSSGARFGKCGKEKCCVLLEVRFSGVNGK